MDGKTRELAQLCKVCTDSLNSTGASLPGEIDCPAVAVVPRHRLHIMSFADAFLTVFCLALEAEASLKATKTIRTTSASELKYLKALQQAYGADFESMARDRKRNVQQYSVGQLRRAFEKAGL